MDCEQENRIAASAKDLKQQSHCVLTLDVDLYQSYLDHADLSDDERQAYLETVWNVVVAFVDLGFEIRARESCGQNSETEALRAIAASSMVKSKDSQTKQEFKAAAEREREES